MALPPVRPRRGMRRTTPIGLHTQNVYTVDYVREQDDTPSEEAQMKGHGPADPLQTPRFAGISTFLRLPHTTASRRRGRGLRRPAVRHRRELSRRGALRAQGDPRGLAVAPPRLQPGAARGRVRAPLGDRLRRRARGAGLHRPLLRQDGARRCAPCTTPARCPSGSAATTACSWPSCGPRPPRTARWLCSCSTRTRDTWDEYFGEKYTHGTAVRRAAEEGLDRRRALHADGHARRALRPRRARRRRASWASP